MDAEPYLFGSAEPLVGFAGGADGGLVAIYADGSRVPVGRSALLTESATVERVVDERTVRAAARIRKCLDEADAGRYGRSGSAWASYMDRTDVELLLDSVPGAV